MLGRFLRSTVSRGFSTLGALQQARRYGIAMVLLRCCYGVATGVVGGAPRGWEVGLSAPWPGSLPGKGLALLCDLMESSGTRRKWATPTEAALGDANTVAMAWRGGRRKGKLTLELFSVLLVFGGWYFHSRFCRVSQF